MRRISAFLRDQRGSQTIQFVLFVPLFMLLLVIVTDASILYLTSSEMENVARDTARRMAAKQLTSETEAEAYAASQLTMYPNTYALSASYDPNGQMVMVISVPVANAMVFGMFLAPLFDEKLEARVTMRAEPDPPGGAGA